MERKIRTAQAAVERFVRSIHKDDDIFLMTFSNKPVIRRDFTSDREKLGEALQKLRIGGGTALYDALAQALAKLQHGRHDKRAILLITDGQDTSSVMKLHEATQAVRESEHLVYCLGISPMTYAPATEHVPFPWPLPSVRNGRPLVSGLRDTVDMNVLLSFAESSGGRAFLLSESLLAQRRSEIDVILAEVADELRSQYTLSYYPVHPDDGRFHSIKVTSRRGYHVRARKGYLARGS
jgi:Ca-activated chloride channel family protein